MINKKSKTLGHNTKQKYFSLTGIAVLLIFLSGILDIEELTVIEMIMVILNFKKIKIPRVVFVILFFLIFHSFITLCLGLDTLNLVLKELFGISVSLIFWSMVVWQSNLRSLIYMYVKYSVFASLVAIIQYIFLNLGLYQFSRLTFLIKNQSNDGRVASIFVEPSEFAIILSPVIFLVIYNVIGKNKKNLKNIIILSKFDSIVILVSYILISSTVGYISILFSVLFIIIEYKLNYKQLIILGIGILFFLVLYNLVPDFQIRINDFIASITGTESVYSTNFSNQTWIINEKIAFESFKNTFGLGSGLGSHKLSYDKYIYLFAHGNILYSANSYDANSLFLRIVSELGIGGIILTVWFLYKYFTLLPYSYRIFSMMCLNYLFVRLVRAGHYFNDGFGLFFILYVYCFLLSKSYYLQSKNNIN